MAHDYDIRLLIGDLSDRSVPKEFKSLLKATLGAYDEERILDQPARSVEQLLPQIAETDLVVATRFHNVLLALVFNKPVIAISFHHKCASLMRDMGLEEYCHDINDMNAGRLIEQFQRLEMNAEKLKPIIRQKVEQSRKALDEQYKIIFQKNMSEIAIERSDGCDSLAQPSLRDLRQMSVTGAIYQTISTQ